MFVYRNSTTPTFSFRLQTVFFFKKNKKNQSSKHTSLKPTTPQPPTTMMNFQTLFLWCQKLCQQSAYTEGGERVEDMQQWPLKLECLLISLENNRSMIPV